MSRAELSVEVADIRPTGHDAMGGGPVYHQVEIKDHTIMVDHGARALAQRTRRFRERHHEGVQQVSFVTNEPTPQLVGSVSGEVYFRTKKT